MKLSALVALVARTYRERLGDPERQQTVTACARELVDPDCEHTLKDVLEGVRKKLKFRCGRPRGYAVTKATRARISRAMRKSNLSRGRK